MRRFGDGQHRAFGLRSFGLAFPASSPGMGGACRSQRGLASGFCADLADSKENIKRAELEFHLR
jgi:hypothetical protein